MYRHLPIEANDDDADADTIASVAAQIIKPRIAHRSQEIHCLHCGCSGIQPLGVGLSEGQAIVVQVGDHTHVVSMPECGWLRKSTFHLSLAQCEADDSHIFVIVTEFRKGNLDLSIIPIVAGVQA